MNIGIFKQGKLPKLMYTGQVINEPNWKFPNHKHDDLCEIIYVRNGEGTFIINNQTYTVTKGDILIYNAGVYHEEYSNPKNPLKTYFCGLTHLLLEGLEENHLVPPGLSPVIHSNNYVNKIENIISEMFEESSSQVLGYDTLCQNLLASLVTLIYRMIQTQEQENSLSNRHSYGMPMKQFLDNHHTKKSSLNDISDQFYISREYISRIFKNNTECFPIGYLLQCQIKEAKRLLTTTNLDIHEISKLVGYENAHYFTMLFKKATGESPILFRTTHTDKG